MQILDRLPESQQRDVQGPWFQKTLLKLISKPKEAASRPKSVPRSGIKVEGSSKRRATSARIARSSRHDIEVEPREPETLAEPEIGTVKEDNSRETDREDSQIRWTEVSYGRKKHTGTKKHMDEYYKSHNENNYQNNDYTEDAGWKWGQSDGDCQCLPK